MSLEVVSPASSTALTTLGAVKTELGLTDSSLDTWIVQQIPQVSSLIEQEANQVFPQQDYEEVLPGTGGTRLMLSRTPILGTPTITMDATTIADFTVEDREAGILYRRQGWIRYTSYWPGIAYDPATGEEEPIFTVAYTAGYWLPSFDDPFDPDTQVRLPPHVERAAIIAISAWKDKRDTNSAIASKRVGDLSISYRDDSMPVEGYNWLPPDARALIRPRIV